MLPPDKVKKHLGTIGRTLQEHAVEIAGLTCFFLAIPFMFLFIYNRLPTLVVVVSLLCYLMGLTPLFSGLSLLAGGLTMGTLMSSVAGVHLYHALLIPAASAQSGRTYTGVFASQPGVTYPDAAVLRFANNATIDSSKTLGMTTLEGGLATLCIAPIVDGDSTGRAEFWAVGLDCCGKLADFACDEAGEATAKGGYVVADSRDFDAWFQYLGKHFAPTIFRRDLFMQAVALAENVHGVASSTKPIMVRWSSEPRSRLAFRMWMRLVVFMVALSLCAVCAAVILAPWVTELRHKSALLAKRCKEEERERLEPLDFQHNVLQGFVLPWLSFAVCMLLTSWSPCFALGGVLSATVTSVLLAIGIAMLTCKCSFRHGVLLILSCLVATYVGRQNFIYNTFPFCSIQAWKSYSDVAPDSSPQNLQDAGRIHFDSSTVVGVEQSVGFRFRGTNYCAAPVFQQSCAGGASPAAAPAAAPMVPAPAPAAMGSGFCTANFWAVGTDCCDPRGGFRCGGEGGNQAVTGVAPHSAVLHDVIEYGAHDEMRRQYLKAVNASSALHNLIIPTDPMLVKVAKKGDELDKMVAEWRGLTLGISLLAVALSFMVFAGLAFAEINLQQQRHNIPHIFD